MLNRPEGLLSRRAQLWIFTGALLVRLGFVLAQHTWGVFFGVMDHGDQPLYAALAHSLLTRGGLIMAGRIDWESPSGYLFPTGPTAWVMPGYPIFVAACRLAFGESVLGVEIIQSILGAAVAVWIARTAALMFGATAGLIAGIIAACHVELVLNTFGLNTEPLYVFLIAWALYALITAHRQEPFTSWSFVKAGLLFGLAALVRPPAFAAALSLASVMATVAIRGKQRARVRHAFALAATCVAVLLPWGLRNELVMNRFTLLSSESGFVFWLGNNPAYDRMTSDYQKLGGYAPALQFDPVPETIGRTEMEIDRIYWRAARDYIAAHPLLMVARMPHKLWNMWRPLLSTSSFRHRLVGYPWYLALIGASCLGLVMSWNHRDAWVLWSFLLLNIGLHAAVTGAVRFRLPLWPALIPLAALAISRGLERASSVARAESTEISSGR